MGDDQHIHRDAQHRRRAFTYLELIIVIGVLGIVASIAVPRFGNLIARRHIDAAATRIATDLALAQREAKFSSTTQTVSFDVGTDSYTLVGMEDPDHPGLEYAVQLTEEPYNASIASADFGGDFEVVFDGYGVPDSDGTLVVAVGNYRKTLTLNADTGRVTVSDVSVEETVPPEQPPEQAE